MIFEEQELERYADILLWGVGKARTGRYAPGDVFVVRFDLDALGLAEVVHRRLLELGFHPAMRLNATPRMERDFFELGRESQLGYIHAGERTLYKGLNGSIALLAPSSLTHLSGIDPKRISTAIVARKALRKLMEAREQQGLLGWSLCLVPTEGLAEHAGASLEEYKQQVVKACYLDAADPVSEWERIWVETGRIKERLNRLDIRSFRVRSESMDLRITPGESRRWLGISGHNIPSFELFTSPDWRGTEGVFTADQPSYRSGNLVRGVRLVFEQGRVVEATAEEGQEFVRGQLAMDEGAAKVGEFSLTDRRFSRIDRFMAHTLYDENFGGEFGNCHIAVGAAYAEAYSGPQHELTARRKKRLGFNDSALHWDLVNTEPKTVTAELASGGTQLVYEDGVFRI
jgi:aminopeptidase